MSERPVFFLHIAKCGGTSFRRALAEADLRGQDGKGRATVRIDHRSADRAARGLGIDLWTYRDQLLAYYLARPDVAVVSGHLRYTHDAHASALDAWNFAVILRDPVERMVSWYHYRRSRVRPGSRLADLSLDEWLDTPFAPERAGDHYVRVLHGRGGPHHQPADQSAVDDARRTLDRFAIVGCLEDPEALIDRVEAATGRRIELGHVNTRPATGPASTATVTAEQRERLESHATLGRAVYDHAWQRRHG